MRLLLDKELIERVEKENLVAATARSWQQLLGRRLFPAGWYAVLAIIAIGLFSIAPPDLKTAFRQISPTVLINLTADSLQPSKTVKVRNALQVYFGSREAIPTDLRPWWNQVCSEPGRYAIAKGRLYLIAPNHAPIPFSRHVTGLPFFTTGLLLSACGAGGSPAIEGTRSWFQALADLDFEQVMKLTCSNPGVRTEIELRLEPFVDVKDSLTALKGQFDFSGLKFKEKSNDGRTATVRLSGRMFLKALGQTQPMPLYEDITVVNDNGVWKVCGNTLK